MCIADPASLVALSRFVSLSLGSLLLGLILALALALPPSCSFLHALRIPVTYSCSLVPSSLCIRLSLRLSTPEIPSIVTEFFSSSSVAISSPYRSPVMMVSRTGLLVCNHRPKAQLVCRHCCAHLHPVSCCRSHPLSSLLSHSILSSLSLSSLCWLCSYCSSVPQYPSAYFDSHLPFPFPLHSFLVFRRLPCCFSAARFPHRSLPCQF